MTAAGPGPRRRWAVRLPIATKLALLVIPLVLVPFVGIGYVLYSTTRATLEVQLQEDLQARLRQVGLRLRPFLQERELDLDDIASLPLLIDYDTQIEYRLVQEAEVTLQKLAEHLGQFVGRRGSVVAEVRYVDHHGTELIRANAAGVHRGGPDQSRLPYFQRARAMPPRGGRLVSVERSESLGVDVLRLARPIYSKWQEFRGVVVLDVPVAHFAGMLADALAGRQAVTFIADASGVVLAPDGAADALAAAGRPPARLAALLRDPVAPPELVHLRDGSRGLLVWTPVETLGWSLGALTAFSETEARVRALTRFALRYGGGAVLVLVLAVTLVARAASRRVRRLQAATAQLMHGNFALRVPADGRDELGDLGRSFNAMAESLSRRDAEVRARTEEAQQRRRELQVLNTVIHAAHTSLDLDESLASILDNLLAQFGFTMGAIRLLDEESGLFRLVAHRGLRPAYAASPAVLRWGEGGIGESLRRGQPVVLNDPAELAEYRDRVVEGGRVGGMLFIPILAKGQPLGAVALGAPEPVELSEAELRLLGSIGFEAGIAIQNARLFSQTQRLLAEAERHRARAEALAEIGRSVTATLQLDRVLDLVEERVGKAMGSDAVAILQLDDRVLRVIRAHGLSGDHLARTAFELGEGPMGLAAAVRATVWTPDVGADARFAGSARSTALFRDEGVRAILAAPIILNDGVWGVLATYDRERHEFSAEDVGFAAAVAQQAAIAIENARLYADLQEAYGQVKAAQEQVVQTEKLGALGQMAGGVAHDFNNLLTAILGRAELLQRRTSDPHVLKGLKVIQQAALDGAETVRRILGFARAKGEEQSEAVDMPTLLEQVVEIARPRWKDESQVRGVAIEVRRAVEPVPPVRGNAAELREVFLNLLFNAVDAMPAGGTITLGTRRGGGDGSEGETVTCFVRDTGVGMPEHVRRRAFDPFFTTKGVKGTGLGLSVVYGIITRHSGRVEIESREGAGTTVSVSLPVFRGEARPEPAAETAAPARARILIVDDEELLADTLADTLRAEGDHAVEVLTDPLAALERLRTDPPDVLFTDLGMPVLSGWDLAGQARALHPDLPVVLVTGWGHQLDREQVRESGVCGVVAKPYRAEDVRRALAAALPLARVPA